VTKRSLSAIVVLSALTGFLGCGKDEPVAPSPPAPAAHATSPAKTGTVLETIAAAPYTYVHVDVDGQKMWVAAPALTVEVGEQVAIPGKLMPMKDWHSKSLNRTFDLVYLAESIRKVGDSGESPKSPAGHPDVAHGKSTPAPSSSGGHPDVGHTKPAPTPAVSVDFSGITKAEGGKTVAEIYAEKDELAGKQVVFRGKVVKASRGKIMGKHWVHVQDGTGEEKARDLTITTAASLAKEGDTVVVTGKVVLDKDFGMGYKYPVLIEEATIEAE